MTETYSLGITGLRADTQYTAETLTLPDSGATGSQNNNPNGLQQTMMLNSQMLCKRADGSLAWYTLDAERSSPSVPVLKAV